MLAIPQRPPAPLQRPPARSPPGGPVSPCWGVPRERGAADTSVPPPAAPSSLGPAPGSAGGSARRDLLSRFIADIIFYCHIKAEAPVALWLPHRRSAPRCSAPRSRLLALRFSGHGGDGALPRPPQSPHWGHNWSHCIHIRDTTGPISHSGGTTGPKPSSCTDLGKIRGCQHLPNRVTLSPPWHGKRICRLGLASFGPSICGTPSPCTPMGAPVCRGRGAGGGGAGPEIRGERGVLLPFYGHQAAPTAGSTGTVTWDWHLVRARHVCRPRAPAPRCQWQGTSARPPRCHGALGSGAAARTPQPAPPGQLLAVTLMQGGRASGADGWDWTDRQASERRRPCQGPATLRVTGARPSLGTPTALPPSLGFWGRTEDIPHPMACVP